MGKKRIPLRKLAAANKRKNLSAVNEKTIAPASTSIGSNRKSYPDNSHSSSSCSSSSGAKSIMKRKGEVGVSASKKQKLQSVADTDDDDTDWEAIERQQNAGIEEDEEEVDKEGSDEDEDDDDEDDDDDGGIRLEGNIEHIQEAYTFEFNDMRDLYTEGICTLLRRMIANPTDAFNLAKLITSQTIVGTVVNNEGDSDTFAFATVIPMNRHQSINGLAAIIEYLDDCLEQKLLSQSNASEKYQLMRDCLSGQYYPNTGLLIHKRFTNLPIQLLTALHRNLEEDIGWAKQQASDDDENNDGSDDSETNTQQVSVDRKETIHSSSGSSSSSSAVSNGNSSKTPVPQQRQRSLSTCSTDSSRQQQFFGSAYYTILLSECSLNDATIDSKTTKSLSEPHHCIDILSGGSSMVMLNCFEDEVYLQNAVAAFLFRPPKKHCTSDLVAMVIPISKIKNCANGICELAL